VNLLCDGAKVPLSSPWVLNPYTHNQLAVGGQLGVRNRVPSTLHRFPAVGEVAAVGRVIVCEPTYQEVWVVLADRGVANTEGSGGFEAKLSVVGRKSEENDQREICRLGSTEEPGHERAAYPSALKGRRHRERGDSNDSATPEVPGSRQHVADNGAICHCHELEVVRGRPDLPGGQDDVNFLARITLVAGKRISNDPQDAIAISWPGCANDQPLHLGGAVCRWGCAVACHQRRFHLRLPAQRRSAPEPVRRPPNIDMTVYAIRQDPPYGSSCNREVPDGERCADDGIAGGWARRP
jgi:hypothetical protein